MTLGRKLLVGSLVQIALLTVILALVVFAFGILDKKSTTIDEDASKAATASATAYAAIDASNTKLTAIVEAADGIAADVRTTGDRMKILARKLRAGASNMTDLSEQIEEVLDGIEDDATFDLLADIADSLSDIQESMNRELLVGVTAAAESMEVSTQRVQSQRDLLSTAGTELMRATKASQDTGNQAKEIDSVIAGFRDDMATYRTGLLITIIGIALVSALLAIFIGRSVTKQISTIIGNLRNCALIVKEASGQVSSASMSTASGASEQAASLADVTVNVQGLSQSTKENADSASQAHAMTDEANRAVTGGQSAIGRLSDVVSTINDSAGQMAAIIKTIDEIAFQTNLLALNAAVEAARAGDAGKGFAVVAEEVRSLAQRSADAARATTELIEEAQQRANDGASVSAEVASALDDIVDSVTKVTVLVGDVAGACDQQAQDLEKVADSFSAIDQVTQQNAASAEQSSAAAEQLATEADAMNKQVATLAAVVGALRQGAAAAAAPSAAPANRPALPQSRPASTPVSQPRPMPRQPTTPPPVAPKPSATAKPVSTDTRKVDPSEVIPLDDDDFDDF